MAYNQLVCSILLGLFVFTYYTLTQLLINNQLRSLKYEVRNIRYDVDANYNKSLLEDLENISKLNISATLPQTEATDKFVVKITHAVVSAMIGDEITLTCTGNYDKQYCSFTNPWGITHFLNSKYASSENGRITVDGNKRNCSVHIVKVTYDDNGFWRCNITSEKYGNYHHVGSNQIYLRAVYSNDLEYRTNVLKVL